MGRNRVGCRAVAFFLVVTTAIFMAGCGVAATTKSGTVSTSPTNGSATISISNVAAGQITSSTATVTWITNLAATGQVEYGTTGAYGGSTPLATAPVTSHSQTVSGLASGTTYHYRVRSKDASGSQAVSGDFIFATTTAGTPVDTTAPVISNINASPAATSAFIRWSSDEPSTSQVEYGTTTSYGQTTALQATLVLSHSVTLSGLATSTVSHYRVRSTDAAGNPAVSSDNTFTTSASSTGGLPTGIGWHSLGSANYSAGPYMDTALLSSPPDGQGSSNQCPKNGFNGDTYRFADLCKSVINAQSSGIADIKRNLYYLWGGWPHRLFRKRNLRVRPYRITGDAEEDDRPYHARG